MAETSMMIHRSSGSYWCWQRESLPGLLSILNLEYNVMDPANSAFRNEAIAGKVATLTHRCHLPLPACVVELPRVCFHSHTLSNDPRTLRTAAMAVRNMINVQTLRIINGHYNLTSLLLLEFMCRRKRQGCLAAYGWRVVRWRLFRCRLLL